MSFSRTVIAATSLLGDIYVVTQNSPTVDVYFCHRPYGLKKSVVISEMKPVDIATSYADVCVYLLDGNDACLWRIHRNLETTEYPLNLRQGEGLRSMSITAKGVILVVQDGNRITMYDPMNEDMRHVSLEGVPESIEHATEIDENRLLACHGMQTFLYNLERGEVCSTMDRGGHHITLKNSKCAIITDKSTQLMWTLDVEKWEIRDERRGIESPRYVHYGMENALLFVAWVCFLDVYSFDEVDLNGHLAVTVTETPPQKQLKAKAASVQKEKLLALAETPAILDETLASDKADINSEDLRVLFQRLSTKCEGQFYYDTKDNTVHVAVPEHAVDVVTNELEEFRNIASFQYQIETPVKSRSLRTCSTTFRAGSGLLSIDREGGHCFLFSGTVLDESTGITVAHRLHADQDVMTLRPQNGEDIRRIVGRCLATFRDVQVTTPRTEFTMSADMAVLDLLPEFYVRRNLVQWPAHPSPGREFRIKIYRGERIPRDTEVMVLDQRGKFQRGFIRREPFTDTFLERRGYRNVYNVLGIGTNGGTLESAITQEGDSGALVLSVPPERLGADCEADVLHVYGIVFSLYKWPSESGSDESSLTVANCIGGVIPKVFVSENVVNRVRNIPVDSIDFTEMAETVDNHPNVH